MISDALTRLSGTRTVSAGVVTETPQDLDPAAAATPLLSEHYMDLSDVYNSNRSNGNLADGKLFAVFTAATETPTAGSNIATIRFQLVTMPRTVVTGQTFTTDFATNAQLITITGGDHLPNGTMVTVSTTTTLPTGLAASRHYFVVRDDECGVDTFKLATTPDGSNRASTTATTIVTLSSNGTGTHTITHVPQIIADSGEVSLQRFRISDVASSTAANARNALSVADQIIVCTNPLPHSLSAPFHRYLFARYVVSHDLTAGMAFCDVGIGVPDNRRIYHASGFTVR